VVEKCHEFVPKFSEHNWIVLYCIVFNCPSAENQSMAESVNF